MPQMSQVTNHARHCAAELAGRSVGNTSLVNRAARRISYRPLAIISGRRSLDGIAESNVSRAVSVETTANSSLTAF
jgi:hypothetical protein